MKLLVYYWSEDARSEMVKRFLEVVFSRLGFEVEGCKNIAGPDWTRFHGQQMVNAFKSRSAKGWHGVEKDLVVKMLGHLCKEIQPVKYSSQAEGSNLQLFVIHIDGEAFGNDEKAGEAKVLERLRYVLEGYEESGIKRELTSAVPELKALACIPVFEFENWLIPALEGSKTKGMKVDDAPFAKQAVARELDCDGEDEEVADMKKAELISTLDIASCALCSKSLEHFVVSVKETVECKKGRL